jgi:very-short-patch-repair endonuclease
MRREPTASEARLFEAVRGGRLGVAFRRQVAVLGRYIVDLLVPELKLVVEVDGGYHAQRERADERRDRALAAAGYRVVRVSAELVMRDLPAAVAVVAAAIETSDGEGERRTASRRSRRSDPAAK